MDNTRITQTGDPSDIRAQRDKLATKLAFLTVSIKKLIDSTEVDGQRYSLQPSCEAWANINIAIDYCEGRVTLFPDGTWERTP